MGANGFHIYKIDDDGEMIYNDEDNDGEDETEMSYDWENKDPEIPSDDDMQYINPNNELDKIFNPKEHPISQKEFREEIVNYFENSNSKNIFALNVLFKEFDQQPYGFMSKPLKDDVLYKIYDLMVDHAPLDKKILSDINVWDQQLEIVDSEDDDFMRSLNPEVEKLADKALSKKNKGKDKKTKDLLKKILSFPDDVKNEAYYYFVNEIAISIDEPETALGLAKEYKEKYPNKRSKLNYLNHLTTLKRVEEFDREFGNSYCISNVLNTKRVSIPDLASYLKILSLRLSLIDSRYGAEILKVIKAVPLEFREELSRNIVPVFMSFILKGRVLDEIYRRVDGEDKSSR